MPYPGGGGVSPLERDELMRRRAEARRRVRARRRGGAGVAAAVLGLVVVVMAVGGDDEGAEERAETGGGARAERPPELPRGGRRIFPRHRVVAYYGAPQADELGTLGIGSPDAAGRRLLRQARAYRRGRAVLPAFELIAVVANGAPGADGRYRTRQKPSVIRRYLAAARRARALLLLDIQPGRAGFLEEMRALEPFLREPDVGLALDPEWHVGPGQVPGRVLGSVDAGVVNAVSARLERIVRERRLPEKLLVVHQFTRNMVRDRERLVRRAGVPIVLDVDGFGTRAQKVAKYRELTRGVRGFAAGLKLFYREDVGLMTPREVLRLRPQPQLVIYE
ncbi:MAG TPA: hypothetical protein VHF45_11320 [Thermoleophilaceae bacterium]|nr:hypothetical protein [Thermoleophilaceae bacterium]